MRYYRDINELPMHNWMRLNAGEMGYLLYDYKPLKPSKFTDKIFEELYNQYIERIGLTKDYLELLEAMKAYSLAVCEWLQTNDSLSYTRKEELKIEIEQTMKGEAKGGSFMQFVAAVEKFQGVEIDLKKISVEKFYAIVKNMEKEYGKETQK